MSLGVLMGYSFFVTLRGHTLATLILLGIKCSESEGGEYILPSYKYLLYKIVFHVTWDSKQRKLMFSRKEYLRIKIIGPLYISEGTDCQMFGPI